MNEQPLSSLEMKLSVLYDQGPSADFIQELGKKLQAHQNVKTSAWRGWMWDLRQSPRVRLAWSAATLLLLTAAFFATPQGRSLAQAITRSFLGYFNVIQATSIPASTMPAEPKSLPTYMIHPNLLPFTPQTTPAVDPSQCGPVVSKLTSSQYCLMLNAQAEAGFPIKGLGVTKLPLRFDGVFVFSNVVSIGYAIEDGNEFEYYDFSQGIGDFPSETSPWRVVPASEVQQVVVGNHPAELVVGGFFQEDGNSNLKWTKDYVGARLRWREGDHWYSISGSLNYRLGWYGQLEPGRKQLVQHMLTLGQNLVPLSAGSSNMAGDVDQTPGERLGFDILLPQALPEGFKMDYITYGEKLNGLDGAVIMWYSFINKGKVAGGFELYEASALNPNVDLMKYATDPNILPRHLFAIDEPVQIGSSIGRYMVKPNGTEYVIWERDGVQFMLQPFYIGDVYGGRFTPGELLAIAESIK